MPPPARETYAGTVRKDGSEAKAKFCMRCNRRKDGTSKDANGRVTTYTHGASLCDDHFLTAATKVPYPLPYGGPVPSLLHPKDGHKRERVNEQGCLAAFLIADEQLRLAEAAGNELKTAQWHNLIEFRKRTTVIAGHHEFSNAKLGLPRVRDA